MIFPIKIIGGAGTNGMPIDVPTAAEMESILSNATAQTAGIIYKYTGTTTDKYINGNLYTVEQSGSAYVFVGLNETVAVQYNLTNCSVAPAPQVTAVGQPFGLNITADSGYKIDDNSTLTVTMGGAAVAQTDKNKVYIASVSGNIIITASATVAALAAPTITLSGSVISWAAVSNATAYRIIASADTAKQTDTTSTSFDLSTWSDLTAGTWTIRVLSTNGTVYSDSSNTVTYIVQNKLATPTIAIDGNTLNITDVENAQKYKIYANDELKTTIPKAPATYKVTFASDFTSTAYGGGELTSVTLTANTGASTPLTSAARGLVWQGVSTLTSSSSIAMGIGYTDISGTQKTFNESLTLTSDITIKYANDTCLTGDMLITLADGTTKRIDTITLDDRVLAYNPETMVLEADEIIYCDSDKIKTHGEYDIWTFSDGTIIKTVHRHRFYNVERGEMVYMDEWKIGEHGRRKDGVLVTLVSHENVKETVNHYTIFTKNQNYFANGLLSGNRYTKPIVFGAKFRERKESDE